ncbi:MAG: YciI family protein [Vicinamibacteria bacterium]
MQFVLMHKQSADEEAGIHPTPEFMAGMGKLMTDATEAGVFLGGEGLKSSHHRVRLNIKGDERTITKGPYAGDNELIAGFALVKVKSLDEAVDWASRFARVIGDGEVEVGEVCEAWDLGFMPKPEGPLPTRYLMLHKSDALSESGAQPSAEMISQMGALIGDMQKAGVFIAAEGLQPSSKAKRLRYKKGKRVSVTDGPFAESKELIAGYSVFELASIDEAVGWADPFGALFDEVEVDIRPLEK